MSWSLRLENGDLSLSGASLGTVINEQKLVQDLRCWILEHMGTDSLHPSFGCLIDGGQRGDGTISQGVIGASDTSSALMVIEGELHRIVGEYQAQQLARAKGDRYTYNKSTLTAREALISLVDIEATMIGDVMNINLHLATGATGTINLTLAVPTNPSFNLFSGN